MAYAEQGLTNGDLFLYLSRKSDFVDENPITKPANKREKNEGDNSLFPPRMRHTRLFFLLS